MCRDHVYYVEYLLLTGGGGGGGGGACVFLLLLQEIVGLGCKITMKSASIKALCQTEEYMLYGRSCKRKFKSR